jgi:hypothetical protein
MRALAIIFAVAALTCGLTAAHYWYRSSIVEIRLDSDFEPVVEELHNRVWFSAAMKAASESARLNRIAALWTAAAVILGTASSIFGSLIGWIDHGQSTHHRNNRRRTQRAGTGAAVLSRLRYRLGEGGRAHPAAAQHLSSKFWWSVIAHRSGAR